MQIIFFLGVSPGLLAAQPCGFFFEFPFSCLFTAWEYWVLDFWNLEFGCWIFVSLAFWMLNPGFWILDFVDLGFAILIPSTPNGLESLVLSMLLWCHRALAKSWDLGFAILIPSTPNGLESLVLSMLLWCHRALAKSWDLGFAILIPSTPNGLESLVLSMLLWCHRALAKSWDLGFGILIPSTTKCLESLVLSMFLVILEVWFCILDFGVWIWRLGRHDVRQKRRKKQHGKKKSLPTRG